MNCLKTVSVAKEIGRTRMWFLSATSMLAYFLVFYTMYQTFGPQIPLVDYGFIPVILGIAAVIPLHLFLHCLPIWLAGKQAHFGYRSSQWPYFYYSAKQPLSKNLSMFSTLFPVLFITVTAIVLASIFPAQTHYIAILSALNFGLSTYDFFAFRQMLSAPNACLIEENRNGFHVIKPMTEQEAK